MTGSLYYWVANWNLTRAQAALLLGNNVVDMVDCTHSAFDRVKQCFPHVGAVGGYLTGTPDIRWTDQDFATARDGGRVVFEIDQSNQDLPLLSDVRYVVKDEEHDASGIDTAISVARQRLARDDDYIIYCSQADLSFIEGDARRAGLPHGQIIAYQWASASSNPHTVLPGGSGTLGGANADLSVVNRNFLHVPSPNLPRAAGTFRAVVSVTDKGEWSVHGTAGAGVQLGGPSEWWESKVGVNRALGHWRVTPAPAEKA